MPDPAPVLRPDCQWCGNTKHVIQYRALITMHPSERITVHGEKPETCRVCPVCDSPGVAASE